ncbi:MAG: hypothetical protein WD737_11490 [Gemmatimonadota bacterium]
MTVVLLAVALALAAAGWVVHPLVFRRWGLLGDRTSADLLNSESRKRVALAALKDVEYDHAAGKLDDRDYAEMRSRLEREALDVLGPVDGDALPPSQPDAEAAGRAAVRSPVAAHGCGFVNPGGSRFCAGCGTRLA